MSEKGSDENRNQTASSNAPDENLKKIAQQSQFRSWVKADGSSDFPAEAGRYHLYVQWACPFASRATAGRSLKGLEDAISMSVVDWNLDRSKGWSFNPNRPGCTEDDANHKTYLREVYVMAKADYDGRITVPVLWDKKGKTIVNNESADILRMLNQEFNAFCKTEEQKQLDLYPLDLQKQIDEINEWVQAHINAGVYKCGFAKSQADYNKGIQPLFEHLDRAEKILQKHRYLAGSKMTEADVRLFTTLVRFDTVYAVLFKCNKKQIREYPSIWGWLREMYQNPKIKKTVNMDHIANHYYQTMKDINPSLIVPIGPDLDFEAQHDRHLLTK